MTADDQVAAKFSAVALTRLADVKPERLTWLWPGRIPVGKRFTVDGDPGTGKSTLAVAITAIVTTAGAWPDGRLCAPIPARCYSCQPRTASPTPFGPGWMLRAPTSPRCTRSKVYPSLTRMATEHSGRRPSPTSAALDEAISTTGARLLVIDVIMAYLPDGTDSHKDQDIRRVLSRLAALADRTGCTVLLLRHLNKSSARDPLYRGGGSIGIVGAARAGLIGRTGPRRRGPPRAGVGEVQPWTGAGLADISARPRKASTTSRACNGKAGPPTPHAPCYQSQTTTTVRSPKPNSGYRTT